MLFNIALKNLLGARLRTFLNVFADGIVNGDINYDQTFFEQAKDYVTKKEVKDDMNVLMDRLEKLHEKVDKLFEVK